VDNCSAHPKIQRLKNIKLVFFPPNLTSVLQPLDLGIIKNVKHYYRNSIVCGMIECIEKNEDFPKITVLDAVTKLAEVWLIKVKPEIIFNCFKKAGFCMRHEESPVETITEEMAEPEFCENWSKVQDALSLDLGYEDYLDIDDGLAVSGVLTDELILDFVNQDVQEIDDETDEINKIDESITDSLLETNHVCRQDMGPKAALNVLNENLLRKENVPQHIFNAFYTLNNFFQTL
jgi:hypothetical protein